MTIRNFQNQTLWTGDNLPIMMGINSETIDLIYLDPPFQSNSNYSAPIGSVSAGAGFQDTWDIDDIDWAGYDLVRRRKPMIFDMILASRKIYGDNMMCYLIYMTPRLMEMHRLLKPTGSIYLHCDNHASHYLKLIMDGLFGKENFLNEIIWFYEDSPGGRNSKWFPRKHDIIFSYAKTNGKHYFDTSKIRVPIKKASADRYKYPRTLGGKTYEGGDSAIKGKIPEDVWQIPVVKKHRTSQESVGYPTQKPVELLKRIISASSKVGDMILDPFCGSGTTCIAVEILNRGGSKREWVGIDTSVKTVEIIQYRMHAQLGVQSWKCEHRTDIPVRTE